LIHIKTPFTLRDYIPKGFFGNDSSNDDNALEDEVIQCCIVVDEWEEVNANPINTTQEVDQVTLRSSH